MDRVNIKHKAHALYLPKTKKRRNITVHFFFFKHSFVWFCPKSRHLSYFSKGDAKLNSVFVRLSASSSSPRIRLLDCTHVFRVWLRRACTYLINFLQTSELTIKKKKANFVALIPLLFFVLKKKKKSLPTLARHNCLAANQKETSYAPFEIAFQTREQYVQQNVFGYSTKNKS